MNIIVNKITTAIAALNTGRFFIGIEKEEKFVEIARKRIASGGGILLGVQIDRKEGGGV